MNLHDEMARAGIRTDASIIVDGQIHRFRVDGKRSKNGWYVFHERNGEVFGAFGDWASGFQSTLGGKSEVARQVMRETLDRSEKKARTAAEQACIEWSKAAEVAHISEHAYLCRKHVYPYDLRYLSGKLLVPMYRDGMLVGLQRIGADGQKRFTPGMKKLGSWFVIPGVGATYVLCEGYATGASIHMATRLPVVVAFDCGNLLPAARNFGAHHDAPIKWLVAADNDQQTLGNPGLTKSFEAAHELNGRLAMPIGTSGTDFNDLHLEHGIEAVTELIYGCL